jgi:hypothetical protein
MQIIGVDGQGRQRCWWCGGLEFSRERMTRAVVVLGLHLHTTKPTLRCEHCGEYRSANAVETFA